MPSSPKTPRHSRHSSSISSFSAEAANRHYSPRSERRTSKSSLNDPITPLRSSFNNPDPLDMSVFASGGIRADSMAGSGAGGNGLGNLADELADALSDGDDDDGGGDEYYGSQDAPNIGVDDPRGNEGGDGAARGDRQGATRDSGVDVETPTAKGAGSSAQGKTMRLSLPAPNGRGHRRSDSQYDGSEYGSESDLDSPGMPPSLVAKMDAIESLARRGTENSGGPADGAFKRLSDGLRDLGSQAGVEGGATRLITAHSALTTHLSHQTRQLQSLTFPLLSPLTAPPDPATIDALLPMLLALSEATPRPSGAALSSLGALHALTAELSTTLNYLSDTLHMSRQTTTTAARRLRSARELVADVRRDDELRDEGHRWLARGNWGERLRRRECAHVCGEVVSGFEEVCNGWRARLLAQTKAEPATA